MIDYALKYKQKFGWSTIPTDGKFPKIKWLKYMEQLPTDEEIVKWWTEYPNANIALVTGKLSGVVVWDCDGQSAIDYMEEKGLEHTLSVQSSAKDRVHYYFQYPDFKDDRKIGIRNLRSFLKVPLEYKGNGGLVTLPPSKHKSGAKYYFKEPINTPIAQMDLWQLEMCFRKKRKEKVVNCRIPAWADILLSFGAEEGNRDNAAYALAKMYSTRGFNYYNILENLQRWNKLKNKPPLSKIQIQKCVKSGCSHV